ncbi:hypothetical protein ANO11243_069620 [Dothideomycetidae sp. 11243]|nr:hypothetical protein ANO11243_069620 [fungal sp. No.11243]
MDIASSDAPEYDTGFGPIVHLPAPHLLGLEEHDSTSRDTKKRPYPSSLTVAGAGGHYSDHESLPLTTFAHYLTTISRVYADDLERGGRFDTCQWMPLFVLGALQLPGTLAFILQHKSGLSLYSSMLQGRKVEGNTGSVTGMLVLGRGRRNRERLSEWYGTKRHCVTVNVEIVLVDGAMRRVSALQWVEERMAYDGRAVADAEGDVREGAGESGISGNAEQEGTADDIGDALGHGEGWKWQEVILDVVW